jgi:hypothetical protein
MRTKLPLKRDLFWLCQRHRNRSGDVGDAARRLLAATPSPDTFDRDLRLMLDKAWEVSDFGFYVSSLRSQGAALNIQDVLNSLGTSGFMESLARERGAA